jgi:hypothetical protein
VRPAKARPQSTLSVHNRVYAHRGDGRDFEALVRWVHQSGGCTRQTRSCVLDAQPRFDSKPVEREEFIERVNQLLSKPVEATP